MQRNGTRSSLVTNPDSISAVKPIVFVCGDPVVNASILSLLYSDTPLPQLYDDTTDCSLGNWHLERGFELLRTFGLVRWGLGGSGHVEGTGEKLSFASQAAR
ncbi:hypothetical protein TNCV_1354911 [Trichonephila clavipes]|uniref:Uncharacterized protein n=1 Tax=Trichonephila clavipes TaxID=2585209 RepID=A0A8X6VJA8_TRICX|nr:hypothetical protein TNCV_1354911 [Trichonephila clavipes]